MWLGCYFGVQTLVWKSQSKLWTPHTTQKLKEPNLESSILFLYLYQIKVVTIDTPYDF